MNENLLKSKRKTNNLEFDIRLEIGNRLEAKAMWPKSDKYQFIINNNISYIEQKKLNLWIIKEINFLIVLLLFFYKFTFIF